MTIGECCVYNTDVNIVVNSVVHILATIHAVFIGCEAEEFVALLMPCY